MSTKIVVARFKNDLGFVEVSREKVWNNFSYFDARKSDYLMEKVNFLENTESSNAPQDVSSYTLKENEV